MVLCANHASFSVATPLLELFTLSQFLLWRCHLNTLKTGSMGKHEFPKEKPVQGMKDKHEVQEAKKPRLASMSNEVNLKDMEILSTGSKEDGIAARRQFISHVEKYSLQEVKDRIRRDEELYLSKRFYLYPAFKEALLRLVCKVEEVQNDLNHPLRLILVHGVPNVGKSSLAECLAYYLALSEGTVQLMKLFHSKSKDTEALSQSVVYTVRSHSVIVDQVNTSSLQSQEISDCIHDKFDMSKSESRAIPLPLILFTSGHYAPREIWLNGQKSGWLCYKLIHMRIDDSFVSKMRQSHNIPCGHGVITNDGLLNVTTSYSRMKQCLKEVKDGNLQADERWLRDFIYPKTYMKIIGEDIAVHLLWLAWQQFLVEGLPKRQDFTDDHCKMRPCLVEYLGILSYLKDGDESGINAVLNSMDITGFPNFENDNYTEYHPETYYYKFLNKKHLYDVLERVFRIYNDITPQQRVDVILKAFNLFQASGGAQYNYLAGGLFEFLIKCLCEAEGDRLDFKVGMSTIKPSVGFSGVNFMESVSTVAELCNLPHKKEKCKTEEASFWCILNVPGRPAFKGYDFAFMVTHPRGSEPVLHKLELFQVTINPTEKSQEKRLLMTDVLGEIKTEMERKKLIKHTDADKIVVPYFLHPFEVTDTLELNFRNSSRKISVEVLSFPQKLLLHGKV